MPANRLLDSTLILWITGAPHKTQNWTQKLLAQGAMRLGGGSISA